MIKLSLGLNTDADVCDGDIQRAGVPGEQILRSY